MKYNILVQNFHEFTGSKQYLPKKKNFSPKIENKKYLSESVSGYYKTKKKMAWTTKPLV